MFRHEQKGGCWGRPGDLKRLLFPVAPVFSWGSVKKRKKIRRTMDAILPTAGPAMWCGLATQGPAGAGWTASCDKPNSAQLFWGGLAVLYWREGL